MTLPNEEMLDRARSLMMAALDDEITGEDRAELDRLLEQDAGLREEWARLGRVKEVTRNMSYREPPKEVWDGYWVSAYNRIERGIGWMLFSSGSAVLLGYGLWKWVDTVLIEAPMPWYLRLALAALLFGTAVILVSVVREKWFTRRHDPYKEVKR